MEKRTRIRWLLDLVACNHPLYYWCYEKSGHILESTCPTEQLFDVVFRHYGSVERLFDAPADTPVVLSNDRNILWLAVQDAESELLHVLGPFFSLNADPRAAFKHLPCHRLLQQRFSAMENAAAAGAGKITGHQQYFVHAVSADAVLQRDR